MPLAEKITNPKSQVPNHKFQITNFQIVTFAHCYINTLPNHRLPKIALPIRTMLLPSSIAIS